MSAVGADGKRSDAWSYVLERGATTAEGRHASGSRRSWSVDMKYATIN